MLDITVHVDIPALEHLAQVLERSNAIACAMKEKAEEETTPQSAAPAAPLAGAPVEAAEEPEEEPKTEEETPQPAEEPEAKEEPRRGCTIDQVMKAAAQLRDQGKLKAITGMFEEFGIHKLSDLKGEKIEEFAERLRGLGAAL